MFKIIVFGLGKIFRDNLTLLTSNEDKIEIVGLSDNNKEMWGEKIYGHVVSPPSDISKKDYDVIVVLGKYFFDIKKQLLGDKIIEERIWSLAKLKSYLYSDYCVDYFDKDISKRKAVIVSHNLNYDGGCLAAVYWALALKKLQYKVVLLTPDSDELLEHEVRNMGIEVIVNPRIPYLSHNDITEISKADVICINVLDNVKIVCDIQGSPTIIWWLHENSSKYDFAYRNVLAEFGDLFSKDSFSDTRLIAVSDLAQKNFKKKLDINIGVVPLGIPDTFNGKNKKTSSKNIVAIIGTVCERKAQDIFLKAAQLIFNANAEFWLIGNMNDDNYCRDISQLIKGKTNVVYKGVLTRAQMVNALNEIDIVVCASLEETMSITIIEGMMYGKACITTDNTGIAEYIQDYENGRIAKTGDVESLQECIQYFIDNKQERIRIGKNARATYEKMFTIEVLAERMKKVIEDEV